MPPASPGSGRNLSDGDVVLEGIRVKIVETAVGSFGLGIHHLSHVSRIHGNPAVFAQVDLRVEAHGLAKAAKTAVIELESLWAKGLALTFESSR